jgi:zinc protease
MRWTDSVIRDTLPNGLTLLVQRDSSVPVVAVVTHVSAGYFDEPDRWVGIAHVLEHMIFKGTPTRGPGVLARETQRLGGYLNASTSYDRTVYYAVVPAAGDGLARAMELQADALMHAALDPDELGRELEVIIQEAKRKIDTPGAVTGETLYELLFRKHRMRRWRIGTEAGLRTLTAADVRAYYESRYTPARTIVVLTGALDPDEALALGHRLYGTWRRPPVPIEPGPVEPPERTAAHRVLRGDVERPLAAVGWRTPGLAHPDAPALDVAAAVLGAGRGSWLSSAVRVPGLASAIGATHYTPGDVGVLDITLTSSVATVSEAVARSVGLTAALAERGPDDGQLRRVRALLDTFWSRRLESADGRATLLAEFEARGGYHTVVEYQEALEAVTADDVRRVADTWLGRNAACGVTYLPVEGAADAGGGWPPPDVAPAPEPVEAPVPARSHTLPRGTRSAIGGTTVLRWPGADVLLRERRGTGLVAVGAYLPGVALREGAANAGITRLLLRTSLRGAAGRGADALAVAAESLGGAVATRVGMDLAGLTLATRAGSAADALALLRSILEQPTLHADDVRREAALQADDAARRRDDMFGYPIEEVLRTAFDGDPYGLPALGDPETVRTLDQERLREWHGQVRGSRVLVVATGDLDRDALEEACAAFGDWPGRATADAEAVRGWRAGRTVEERDKAQTALAMAFPGPPAASGDRHALAVLAALLSGLAGRLFDELRERRALAYTVHAAPWLRRRGGAVLTYIATSPEREDEARTAMLDVLCRVADGPLGDDELERAARYAAGQVAIRRQHGAAIAEELADAWVLGRIEAFDAEEDRRRSVSAQDVRRVARASLDPDRGAEFVVRGVGGGR